MRANVRFKSHGFEGSFPCTIEINEWQFFVQAMRDLEASIGEDANVSWGNMEENIEFRFALHKRGTLEAEYRLSPENFSLGPTLSGTFEADQTFLRGWINSAELVLEHPR